MCLISFFKFSLMLSTRGYAYKLYKTSTCSSLYSLFADLSGLWEMSIFELQRLLYFLISVFVMNDLCCPSGSCWANEWICESKSKPIKPWKSLANFVAIGDQRHCPCLRNRFSSLCYDTIRTSATRCKSLYNLSHLLHQLLPRRTESS